MSFSSDVRGELCELKQKDTHCQLAELSAILNTLAEMDDTRIVMATDNVPAIQRVRLLLRTALDLSIGAVPEGHGYSLTVPGPDAVRIRSLFKGKYTSGCCKRAYIRGSFIAAGTISDPLKTYHLEFNLPPHNGRQMAGRLSAVLRGFGLHPKTHGRRSRVLVYIKEGEEIVDLLNIMEAYKSLLQLENVRILKEMRNSVNRQVNFETANLNKTVNASVKQLEDIHYISNHVGLGFLADPLEKVARLRLACESASLKEIGEMLDPPVGKSGVNHRLRKISDIAENLRGGGIT